MNTKITRCCSESLFSFRTTLLGYLPKHSGFSLPTTQVVHQHATLNGNKPKFPAVTTVLNVPVLRITARKGMILQNRTAHMCCAIFLNKDYVWHFSRVRHFDNKHVLFHNMYCENSVSLHGLVARHAFSLHRTFSGGSFFSQMMHFIARVSSQSKNLPVAML